MRYLAKGKIYREPNLLFVLNIYIVVSLVCKIFTKKYFRNLVIDHHTDLFSFNTLCAHYSLDQQHRFFLTVCQSACSMCHCCLLLSSTWLPAAISYHASVLRWTITHRQTHKRLYSCTHTYIQTYVDSHFYAAHTNGNSYTVSLHVCRVVLHACSSLGTLLQRTPLLLFNRYSMSMSHAFVTAITRAPVLRVCVLIV